MATAKWHVQESVVESPEEDDGDFEGKLLHQSCLWDNSDLLSDLLFGDEVCVCYFIIREYFYLN